MNIDWTTNIEGEIIFFVYAMFNLFLATFYALRFFFVRDKFKRILEIYDIPTEVLNEL